MKFIQILLLCAGVKLVYSCVGIKTCEVCVEFGCFYHMGLCSEYLFSDEVLEECPKEEIEKVILNMPQDTTENVNELDELESSIVDNGELESLPVYENKTILLHTNSSTNGVLTTSLPSLLSSNERNESYKEDQENGFNTGNEELLTGGSFEGNEEVNNSANTQSALEFTLATNKYERIMLKFIKTLNQRAKHEGFYRRVARNFCHQARLLLRLQQKKEEKIFLYYIARNPWVSNKTLCDEIIGKQERRRTSAIISP